MPEPEATPRSTNPQPKIKPDKRGNDRGNETAANAAKPQIPEPTSTLPSTSIASEMPGKPENLKIERITIELLSLKCIEPINPIGTDQVVLEIHIDGEAANEFAYPNNFQGTPCAQLSEGKQWPINAKLTFEKEVSLTFREINGFVTQTLGRIKITEATIQQQTFTLRVEGGNFMPHQYELTWKESN